MNKAIRLGSYLFAVSMTAFGAFQFVFHDFLPGLLPAPGWIIWHAFWVYLTGVILVTAGVSILINIKTRLAATILGIFWILSLLILHIYKVYTSIHNGIGWAPALEVLAICAGAMVVFGTAQIERPGQKLGAENVLKQGRILFAVLLPAFGILHFIYIDYVSFVIPAWIPWHLFWAYFTGIAFIVAGLSILTKVMARLAATLLSVMFGLWFLILHIPRLVAHRNNIDEWTSAYVALAMCGISLMVAGSLARKNVLEQSGPK